jgi:hypothetical protein
MHLCRRPAEDQPLLDYGKGGKDGKGWQHCIGVRWGQYKWNGDDPDRLFKIVGNNHIERECNRLDPDSPSTKQLIQTARAAAERWWYGLAAEPHSFRKPTFLFNFRGQTETNVIVDGAFDRTPGRVVLQPQGASGFSQVGDYVAFRALILQPGTYKLLISYSSSQACTMKLSVGSYRSIARGAAASLDLKLPKQVGIHVPWVVFSKQIPFQTYSAISLFLRRLLCNACWYLLICMTSGFLPSKIHMW